MWRKFRLLGRDRAVDVDDFPFQTRNLLDHRLEQLGRIRAGPLGIGVRIPLADIAESGRTQQSVGDRVQQHVRVAVADQAALKLNRYAAKDELSTAREAVGVL